MNSNHRHALVSGLIGDEHAHLYSTSASFKAGIDTLVLMLPAMIDGLASQANTNDEKIREAAHLLSKEVQAWPV